MKILCSALASLLLAASVFAHSGKVLETMNSGGYTYVKLQTSDGPVWLAGPESKVKKGDTISTDQGNLMSNFNARSLNRTFDKIWFVSSINGPGAAMKGNDPHAGIPGFAAGNGPKNKASSSSLKPKAGSIAKASQTVADVYAKKAALKGKMVEVRGVVTKYSGGIMGKNWLHIMDGSGAAGSDDLSVTTKAEVKVGDRVLIKGKLNTAVDVGSGYFYDVLVEDATVKVERSK